MCRAPVVGRCKTRLAKAIGHPSAAGLYAAMLADRIAAIDLLPVRGRVLLAAPEDDGVAAVRALFGSERWRVVAQRGEGLGERLSHAAEDLLAEEGGALVCLLDSDSPALDLASLLPTLTAPRDPRRIVLVPSADGGYSLIGMYARYPALFEGIPWSTSRVAATTREACARLGLALVETRPGWDVDEPSDLERLRREIGEIEKVAPRTAAFVRELDRARARS